MSSSTVNPKGEELISPVDTAATRNGPLKPYDQTVSAKRPPSKAEIEARLQRASDSITAHVQAIQDEFNLTGKSIKGLLQNPFVGVLASLGAGLLVGRIFRGSSGNRSRAGDHDALAELLSREVRSAIESGEAPETAIHRVVDSVHAVADKTAPGKTGSALRWIAVLALRSILSHGIRTAAEGLTSNAAGAEDINPPDPLE